MTTIRQKAPDINTYPSANFEKPRFEVLIEQKGYDSIIEKAIRCPCRSKGAAHQPLPDCKNCGGTGWAYINPIQTKVVLHSMNISTKFKEWSEENRGTVSISAKSADVFSFMDKLTVMDSMAIQTEILTVKKRISDDSLYATTIYDIEDMIDIFLFKSSTDPYIKLNLNTNYTFEYGVIRFQQSDDLDVDSTITVRYKHRPVFYILDLPREVMTTYTPNQKGKWEPIEMPIHAVGRRAHYVLNKENIDRTLLIDNSYNDITLPTP